MQAVEIALSLRSAQERAKQARVLGRLDDATQADTDAASLQQQRSAAEVDATTARLSVAELQAVVARLQERTRPLQVETHRVVLLQKLLRVERDLSDLVAAAKERAKTGAAAAVNADGALREHATVVAASEREAAGLESQAQRLVASGNHVQGAATLRTSQAARQRYVLV